MSGVGALALGFVDRRPEEAARALEDVGADQAAAWMASLSSSRRRELLERMELAAAGRIVDAAGEDGATALMEGLSTDRVIALMRRIHPDLRGRLLAAMQPSRRVRLERALRYPASSAAALAESDPPVAAAHHTVAEARRRLDVATPGFPYLYVVGRDGRLEGVLSAAELRAEPDGALLSALMVPATRVLRGSTPAGDLPGHPGWIEFDVLPVVDSSGSLLGALRHRRLRRLAGPALARASAPRGGAVALATTYCDLLAGALVALTTVPTGPGGAPA